MTFCSTCGKEITDGGVYCVECGSKTSTNNSTKAVTVQKRSNFWYILPIVFAIFGGVIAYFVLRKSDPKKARNCLLIGMGMMILGIAINLNTPNSSDSNSDEIKIKNPELSPTQIRASALSGISYDQLMRGNENYVDQTLYLEGKIIQVQRSYGDNYDLRVSITKENLGYGTVWYSDPIWVNYEGDRVLEEDIVGIYGKVKGVKEYKSVLGSVISLPEVDSLLLNVISKGD